MSEGTRASLGERKSIPKISRSAEQPQISWNQEK